MNQDFYPLMTEGARDVTRLADKEARDVRHHYIDAHHVLAGLIRQRVGIAGSVLNSFGVGLKELRAEVAKYAESALDPATEKALPLTPRVKQLLEYASEEATRLGHNFIGTEHLLLGLIRVQDCLAVQVLQNLGVNLEDLREKVLDFLLSEAVDFVPSGSDVAYASDGALRFLLDNIMAQAAERGYAVTHIQVYRRLPSPHL